MKKGIGPAIAVLGIALLMIGLSVAFIAGSIWGRQHAEKKYLFEASLISQSDKVETYVRSFQRAADLSSIQAIHDTGTGQIILPYDFDFNYSSDYNLPYWQIYDNKYISPNTTMINKLRQSLAWISSSYLKQYHEHFEDFSDSTGFGMQFSESSILKIKPLGEDGIHFEASPMWIYRETTVEAQPIMITREFLPYSDIGTKFIKAIEIAREILTSDELNSRVKDNYDDTVAALNDLAQDKSGSGIKVIFELEEDNYIGPPNPKALINVKIYDKTVDYALYSFPDNEVKLGFLGVNFLAKAGDPTGGDPWPVNTVDELIDNGFAKRCNQLGIMSMTRGICDFFTILPEDYKACSDSDGTCKDFTGSYTDLCIDGTLYEYYCHASEICHYKANGACITVPMQTEELFIDSFDSSFTEWVTSGPSPWLGDNDDRIYHNAVPLKQGNFTFADHAGTGTLVSVNLTLEVYAYLINPGDHNVTVYLYDGSGWQEVWKLNITQQAWHWRTKDVTSYLDTWTKVDNAEVMFETAGIGVGVNHRFIRRVKLVVDYTT